MAASTMLPLSTLNRAFSGFLNVHTEPTSIQFVYKQGLSSGLAAAVILFPTYTLSSWVFVQNRVISCHAWWGTKQATVKCLVEAPHPNLFPFSFS